MSKTQKKLKHNQPIKRYEDGYHSKNNTNADIQRKQLKHLDNAIRSRDLNKLLNYEDAM